MSEAVRIATKDDEEEIIRLLHIMHAEGGLLPLDEDEARKTFNHAFMKRGGMIGVIGDPGDIQAMIYLLISRFWYTKENHLEELFNFVRPDVRKSDHAKHLIEFAKRCSEEIKIPLVIGVLTNTRMEGKVRLYRRVLGIPAGAFFVHNAHWVNTTPSSENFWHAPFPNRIRSNGSKKEHRSTQ